MSRTTLALIVITTILAGLSSWLSREQEADPLSLARSLPHIPDYYIAGFSAAAYSAEGIPRHRLSAERMTRYADDHTTELLHPQLIFSDEGSDSWQLEAGRGSLDTGGDTLRLTDTVSVKRQSGSGTTEFRTESLTVEPRKQYATTRSPVIITAPHTRIEAAGLDADFAGEKLVLYSVRGRYEP